MPFLLRRKAAARRPGIPKSARGKPGMCVRVGKRFGEVALAETPVWIVMVVLAVVEEPVKLMEGCWKLQDASPGRPVQENWTVPE